MKRRLDPNRTAISARSDHGIAVLGQFRLRPGVDVVYLIGGRSSLTDVSLGGGASTRDSVAMPNQARLNLYATLLAALGFVFLAFSHG
jgi:hypothetical protein